MSVRKAKHRNRWITTIETKGARGERKRKTKSFKTQKEAKTWEKTMLQASEEINIYEFDIAFKDLAKRWIDHKKLIGLADSTIAKYENALRVLKGFMIYNKKAREIKMSDIESVLVSLGSIYAKSYVQDIKATVSAVLNFGVDEDYLIKNPCVRASMPRETQPGRTIDSFTKEEVEIIESYRDEIPFGDVIYVMLNTGLRSQEVCAIDKSSVSVKNDVPYLLVDKAMKRSKQGTWELGTTKTEASRRENPISNEVYQIILKRIFRSPYQTFLPGTNSPHLSYTGFLRMYKRFFKELNEISPTAVRYLAPHCCRHTYSSRCEWSGIPIGITMEMLGHTSEKMTYNYTHIMNKDKERAVLMII